MDHTVLILAALIVAALCGAGMNMAAIRPIGDIADKWSTVTPQRAQEYQDGVTQPLRDWKTNTSAANANWKAGVASAAAADTFNKGVNKAGTAKWQKGATEKGVARWGPGVQLATNDYASAFAPYVNAIKALNLPPRFARRDPRNLDRVKAVVDAMINTAKTIQ